MGNNDRLLAELKALPRLADGRDGPDVDSWPMAWEDELQPLYVELARITGRFPLQWAHTSPISAHRSVGICMDTDAKLTVHCSPYKFPVVGDRFVTRDAHQKFCRRWAHIMSWIDKRVPVDRVYVDLEKDYVWEPKTANDRQWNRLLGQFHDHIYETIKSYCGDACEVGWYKHLARQENRRYSRYTRPTIPDDLGWACSAYNPADRLGTIRHIKEAIEQAALAHVTQGTVWLSLGASEADWQIEPWTKDGVAHPGKMFFQPSWGRLRVMLYDCKFSHEYGSMCVDGDSRDRELDGASQRDGRFPIAARIKRVNLFGSPFDRKTETTAGPHLIAFLHGLLGRPAGDMSDLHDWQVELWEQEN